MAASRAEAILAHFKSPNVAKLQVFETGSHTESNAEELVIRNATPEEICGVMTDMQIQAGYNIGKRHSECYLHLDKLGFIVALLGGKVVGCIAVPVVGNTCHAGWYLVDNNYRGRGIGKQLLIAAEKHIEGVEYRSCDCYDDMVPWQEKLGYKPFWNTTRYGVLNAKLLQALPAQSDSIIDFVDDTKVFEDVIQYDFITSGSLNRQNFMDAWIRTAVCSKAFVQDGDVLGFGVLSQLQTGYKIGPLMADDKHIAMRLVRNLVAHIEPSEVIYWDIPFVNNNAVSLIVEFQMEEIERSVRCFRDGKIPEDMKMDKIYGTTDWTTQVA